MPEPIALRRAPLHGLALPVRAGVVAVADAGPFARFVYRGPGDLPVAASFGVDLPHDPMRAATAGTRAALWLGPDEWLLLAPEADGAALPRDVATALAGRVASLVDVGHRQAALTVSGPRAADLIASGCPLDLDLGAYPTGMVTRTLLAKAEIVLWRRADELFHVEVARSYTAYVTGWLLEAARDVR
jgi:sarcosine oxidase subunit gamma